MNFREQAQHFLEKEKEFHLGDLVTEHPHPNTAKLSEITQGDTSMGVRALLSVDRDIPPVVDKVFKSAEYSDLIKAISTCIKKGKRLCFSSCGASGRLAIILEAMWRDQCRKAAFENPGDEAFFRKLENQVYSIMTGGDRALIRSVENFEDYQVFGRRQFIESGLGEGDLMIALTEGGEISSVIGSMKEALERKTRVFMLFNNPADLLVNKFERSRDVILNPDIIKIDLTTGPMSLAGSTRMQATTTAMLVTGAAIEEAFSATFIKDGKEGKRLAGSFWKDGFSSLLDQLNSESNIRVISNLADRESECFLNSGRVTYTANTYLLDIFSDTTERAPTFMVPPFRQFDDTESPAPWAFARDPLRKSHEAWLKLLRREPRGLDWTGQDYEDMGVPLEMKERAGTLNNTQICKFHIGNEDDPSRYDCPDSLLVRINLNEPENPDFDSWWDLNHHHFTDHVILEIGHKGQLSNATHTIKIDFPCTMTKLFEHLAIKLIFNTLSTAAMAKSGRIKGNWMIQLDATNKKLTDRAARIISHFAGIGYEEACLELFRTMNEPGIHRLRFEKSYVIQTLERLGKKI